MPPRTASPPASETPTETGPGNGQSGTLPDTGGPPVSLLGLAGVLVAVGLLLLARARRRRLPRGPAQCLRRTSRMEPA
ncbi:MAG: LPXTG cell wall anchor domain-containing protein [Nocardioides sp.]|nr:LPXTG cell wall anchor domain-containing protein [Nocardioides sp.]